ncbi:MAG TPA: hypothetical protein VK154_14925 [Chitinophagales bacterium]|nr:hypothetical protein [Chitinophagales bacterium]
MKKSISPRRKAAVKPTDVQSIADTVVSYLGEQAKNMDKATLAKYVAIAVLVIYGIRKSNVLGSLAISLITGVVSKYLAERFEGHALADLIPASAKA